MLGKIIMFPYVPLYFGARVYHHRQDDFAPEIWDKKKSLLRIFLLQSNGRDDTLIWSLTFKTNQRSFDVEFQVDTINPVWSSFTWPWPAHKHQGNLASFKTQSIKFQNWSVRPWKKIQTKTWKSCAGAWSNRTWFCTDSRRSPVLMIPFFFLRSSFESSVWRYFHALSSTVLACLESILLLPLLMRWPNQKAAVQKQKITSKVQLPCFELFHDSYDSGFSRDYLHIWHLSLFIYYSCLIFRQVMPAWEIFWIWVRWSKHLGRLQGGRDRRTGHRNRRLEMTVTLPAMVGNAWSSHRISQFIHHSHAKSRCS